MNNKLFDRFPDPTPTFDCIRPLVEDWLKHYQKSITNLLCQPDDWLIINRDLNGRVRLLLPERFQDNEHSPICYGLAAGLMQKLGRRGYPPKAAILFESSRDQALRGAVSYKIDCKPFPKVWLADRLASESNWTCIAPESAGVPRIVFYSIKGGVGRSTALAATAWHMAQAGKRVLVLDLDLESPGLLSALLKTDRQPQYGITDWLVEDLVDNGAAVFKSMVATSDLALDGEIYVVPAHGAIHGEYIAKLGRVWMPKVQADGTREIWSARLERLLKQLESSVEPDVILIDSRSGIDEVASACITDIGANLILLFALDGSQTWNGYRLLFEQWQHAQVAEQIRERLKIVAAMVPELERVSYLEGLRENAYSIFLDTLYDEIAPAPAISTETPEGWSFDEADEGAPHYPLTVHWNRGFASLRSLHGRLAGIDTLEVQSIFGSLIDGASAIVGPKEAL